MSDFEDFIRKTISKGDINEARRRWQPQYKDQRYGGWTILHWACMHSEDNHRDLVSLLVSLGCDIEAEDDVLIGWRPLHVSICYDSQAALKALLEEGCSLSPLDNEGMTPLMMAESNGYDECASLLKSAIKAAQRPSMTNYVEGDLLGSGKFARVYKCHDPEIDKYFAIKKVSETESDMRNAEMQSMENEINIYSKLNYHKRIVRYFGATRNEYELIIFMEYVPNGSLRDLIIKAGPFSIMTVTKYSRQILEGLEFLHGHKIIHRDIKCANIMRDADDNIKLVDFGISKSRSNRHYSDVGTPQWMAPEVITGTRYSYRADVWSLGATILEMLTGKPPYHEFLGSQAFHKIANGSPVDPYFPSNLDQKTKTLLQKIFVHDPSERADVKTLLKFHSCQVHNNICVSSIKTCGLL